MSLNPDKIEISEVTDPWKTTYDVAISCKTESIAKKTKNTILRNQLKAELYDKLSAHYDELTDLVSRVLVLSGSEGKK